MGRFKSSKIHSSSLIPPPWLLPTCLLPTIHLTHPSSPQTAPQPSFLPMDHGRLGYSILRAMLSRRRARLPASRCIKCVEKGFRRLGLGLGRGRPKEGRQIPRSRRCGVHTPTIWPYIYSYNMAVHILLRFMKGGKTGMSNVRLPT
jgi:hypothetical protein